MRGVSRRFGRLVALDQVSFHVEPGEIVALLGPNGAGKTTASRIIGGILAPNSGDVVVAGKSVVHDPNAVRRACGMVTDQPSLYELEHPAKRVNELAVMLGLADRLDARLGSFSRGMKQKVAIARGLVHDPPVLLLDEPATALDPETALSLRAFIVSLRARHRAILLCTHDLDEAQRIADRVVVLYRGRVAREGTTDALRAVDRPTFVVSFDGPEAQARAALERVGVEATSASVNGTSALRFTAERAADTNSLVLRALLDDGVRVITLVREERTLEEAYFAIVSQAGQS